MIITYYGKQFFKVQQGEMVLAFNPVSKKSKSGINARFGADIAFVTTNHPDYNGVEQLSYGDREPFVIDGPGDYEVREIFVKGVQSNTELAKKKHINTVYTLAVDGINMVFLGAYPGGELDKSVQGALEETDILFIPVGNNDLLDGKGAAKFISSIEPKMVIPMDYDSDSLKSFLKAVEVDKPEVVDKITLKRKDLSSEETKVVVLKAQG